MIAAVQTPVSCTLDAWIGHSNLKPQASSAFCRRAHFSSFQGSSLSSPSLACDCLVDKSRSHHQSAVVSKAEAFIEDNLRSLLSEKAGSVRQIVLVTDGEDLIPCRLQWPPLTVIFHVSSNPVVQVLEVPKTCLLRYIHGELEQSVGSEGWTDRLQNAGYQGNKPSLWVVQGINFEAEKLSKILENISSLMMQGSAVIGCLFNKKVVGWREDVDKPLLEKTLMGSGFRMKSALYDTTSYQMAAHILFVAEQLRLSDDQVEYVKREMERAEESGDEETFEDWL